MFNKKQAVVRTKKYGRLIRLSLIFATVALIAGLVAYGWQEYEEKKYPEGTEMDYSLPNAFIDFARLISDFITQNQQDEDLQTENNETQQEDEKDNIIIVGSENGEISSGDSSEEEKEPEIRGGIVPESEAYNSYEFINSLFVGDYFVYQAQSLGFFEQTKFAYVTGLDMNTVLTKKALKAEDDYVTLAEYAATFENIDAVYIMFSAESVSWMDYPTFVKKYTAFVDEIISTRPEAHIYIQPLLPINEEKAAKRSYSVTNEKINEINNYIYDLAEEKSLWILDMAEIFMNKEGELPAELTTNGIRLEKETYETWAEYITTHKAH